MISATETLSQADFGVIARFVQGETGIRLPAHKRGMVQVRVAGRLKKLGLDGFSEYVDFVFGGPSGLVERGHLVDAITTNKTDFFREAHHFGYLTETVLPDLLSADPRLGESRPLVAWCAACSTGEEPYTLAMLLKNYSVPHPPLDFVVHATDISSRALECAGRGVYSEEQIRPVPHELRHAYLLRSRDRSKSTVRIGCEVRSHVRFEQANLLCDPQPVTRAAHIVFCRNVLIYFDRATQARALRRVIGAMRPDGYLFVGHSEGLLGFDLPLERVAASVYRLRA